MASKDERLVPVIMKRCQYFVVIYPWDRSNKTARGFTRIISQLHCIKLRGNIKQYPRALGCDYRDDKFFPLEFPPG